MSNTRWIRRRIVKSFGTMTMKKLLFLMAQEQIYFSKRTQRLKCWDDIKKHLYMQSVICNINLTPIIIIHIDACIRYCENYHSEDVKFFQKLKAEGFLYVSSDGQQRTWAMIEFVGNKVKMHEGLFHFIRYDHQVSLPHFPYTDETETEFLPNFLKEKDNIVLDFDAKEMHFRDFFSKLWVRI